MIETVQVSSEIIRKAIAALQGIETSSQKINQIIGVIDGITSQTSLFALNAKVEASTIGNAGRAFSTIASEVHALVHRTNDAAKEINSLLSISRMQVEDGAQLVGKAGTSLQKIIARITEINSVVSQISASAEQQALGLQEVNMVIGQMDKVTLQTSKMVEQVSTATRILIQQSGDLAWVVARFTAAAAGAITRVLEVHIAAPRTSDLIGPFSPNHTTSIGSKSNNSLEEF